MKLKNALLLPVTAALDVVTLGTLEITENLRASDRAERRTEAELEALRLLAEIMKAKK